MGMLKIITGNIVDDGILRLADAVVLPTNPMMRCGAGVSGAIFKKAGVDALERYTERTFGISYYDFSRKNEMKTTEVRVTPGFDLPCDIIFAQGPKVYQYGRFDDALAMLLRTYQNVLETALECDYRTILTPAMGTGTYGFGHKETAETVVKFIQSFVEHNDLTVYLVLYENGIDTLYRKYMK